VPSFSLTSRSLLHFAPSWSLLVSHSLDADCELTRSLPVILRPKRRAANSRANYQTPVSITPVRTNGFAHSHPARCLKVFPTSWPGSSLVFIRHSPAASFRTLNSHPDSSLFLFDLLRDWSLLHGREPPASTPQPGSSARSCGNQVGKLLPPRKFCLRFGTFIWYKQFTESSVWLAGHFCLQLSSLSGI
jgi:hypothetical protein